MGMMQNIIIIILILLLQSAGWGWHFKKQVGVTGPARCAWQIMSPFRGPPYTTQSPYQAERWITSSASWWRVTEAQTPHG
jgi:hypothetical protein